MVIIMSKLQVRKVVPLGQIKFIVQLFLLRTLDLGKQRRTKVVHNLIRCQMQVINKEFDPQSSVLRSTTGNVSV